MAAACAQRGGGGLSLCLASAGVVKTLSIAAFTLAWTHSVEKVDWQEDWRITPAGTGTGAGACQGLRRRHGAAAGGAIDRWLVPMAAEARGVAGSRARQFRGCWRMAAMP